MPWEYSQTTGRLTLNGVYRGTGYSGAPGYRDNPWTQWSKGRGVIPIGTYRIEKAIAQRGMAHVMDLTPTGHNALGRNNLEIHGDKKAGPKYSASTGCIILEPALRIQISYSGDNKLIVKP